jgi:hypothetical protein
MSSQQNVQNGQAAATDTSKVLQDLLGLGALITQLEPVLVRAIETGVGGVVDRDENTKMLGLLRKAVGGGIKDVCDDQDYLKILSSIVGDSVVRLMKSAADDKDESAKNLLSEAFYLGGKRLVSDADAQKSLARIGSLIVSSQDVVNTITRAVDTSARRQREFFQSKEFTDTLTAVVNGGAAMLKEQFNLSIMEASENIKSLELRGNFGFSAPQQ